MKIIRLLDPRSLKLFSFQARDIKVKGYRIVILGILSIGIIQEDKLQNSIAFHLGIMPLRLFLGFSTVKTWVF